MPALDTKKINAQTTFEAERQSKMTDIETGWNHTSSSEQDRVQFVMFGAKMLLDAYPLYYLFLGSLTLSAAGLATSHKAGSG